MNHNFHGTNGQFDEAKKIAAETAPRVIDYRKPTERNTEFGERYDDLPSDPNELDAVIDDLTEDLSGSVHNPQVVQKYKKVRLVVIY